MPNTVISLTLRASDRLRGWLLAGHAFPFLLLLYLYPQWINLLLIIPVIYFWHRSKKIFGLMGLPCDIRGIAFADGQWTLTLYSGTSLPVELISSIGFYRFWLFLLFRDENGEIYRAFIVDDSTDQGSFRKLRVLLSFVSKKAGFRF
ncbi:protein YgfX [Oceanospirillum sp.]|uniref:protein YgfX n=1 Tax=Oceanospirillum sp. TaxID=2021254 RepID=UPI003A8CCC8C